MENDLAILYGAAWQRATREEQQALRAAAGVDERAEPSAVFTSIARQARRLDPGLVTLLWDELEVEHRVHRIELGEVVLSPGMTTALQMALAYELGQRIERIIVELGGVHNPDITQEELEAKAGAYGVAWQAVSYAIGRELTAAGESL
jgi:hypothetical protein